MEKEVRRLTLVKSLFDEREFGKEIQNKSLPWVRFYYSIFQKYYTEILREIYLWSR